MYFFLPVLCSGIRKSSQTSLWFSHWPKRLHGPGYGPHNGAFRLGLSSRVMVVERNGLAETIAASHNSAEQGSAHPPLDAAGIAAELKALGTSEKGLSAAEAKTRLARYGRNAIEAHEVSRWRKLVG